jgi:hypothetical protein
MPSTKAPVKYKELCHDKEKNVVIRQFQYYSLSKKSSQKTSIEVWKI